jgi:putative transposase
LVSGNDFYKKGVEMPDKPRFCLRGVPAHAVRRENSLQAVFFSEEDYQPYLPWFKEGCDRNGCVIHTCVLMTTHVHLLVSPDEPDSISRLIQLVGRHSVSCVNHRQGRCETFR